MECILLESIRTEYVLKQLKRANAAYAAHPPALYELLKMKKRKSFYYPYPDIYEEERELLLSKYKEVKTPKSDNREIWNNVRVGISMSGPDSSDLLSAGIDENHLTRLSVELAGFLLVIMRRLFMAEILDKMALRDTYVMKQKSKKIVYISMSRFVRIM